MACRKTCILIHPTTLPDGQTVNVYFDQRTHYDRLIFKINRKWANQLHSKKGIGTWLNLTSFIKSLVSEIDLNDLQAILMKRPPMKKYAKQGGKKDLVSLMREQLLLFQNKQTLSLTEEKNQVVLRMLIQIIRDRCLMVKSLNGGLHIMVLRDQLTLKESVKRLLVMKEERKEKAKKLVINQSKDHLSHMAHIRQQAEKADHLNNSLDSRVAPDKALYDWKVFYSIEKGDAPDKRPIRRSMRRNDFHPVLKVNDLDVISEAGDMIFGRSCLRRSDTSDPVRQEVLQSG